MDNPEDDCYVSDAEIAILILNYARRKGWTGTVEALKRDAQEELGGYAFQDEVPGVKTLHEVVTEYVEMSNKQAQIDDLRASNPVAASLLNVLDFHVQQHQQGGGAAYAPPASEQQQQQQEEQNERQDMDCYPPNDENDNDYYNVEQQEEEPQQQQQQTKSPQQHTTNDPKIDDVNLANVNFEDTNPFGSLLMPPTTNNNNNVGETIANNPTADVAQQQQQQPEATEEEEEAPATAAAELQVTPGRQVLRKKSTRPKKRKKLEGEFNATDGTPAVDGATAAAPPSSPGTVLDVFNMQLDEDGLAQLLEDNGLQSRFATTLAQHITSMINTTSTHKTQRENNNKADNSQQRSPSQNVHNNDANKDSNGDDNNNKSQVLEESEPEAFLAGLDFDALLADLPTDPEMMDILHQLGGRHLGDTPPSPYQLGSPLRLPGSQGGGANGMKTAGPANVTKAKENSKNRDAKNAVVHEELKRAMSAMIASQLGKA